MDRRLNYFSTLRFVLHPMIDDDAAPSFLLHHQESVSKLIVMTTGYPSNFFY
jgi:hypothetical protein